MRPWQVFFFDRGSFQATTLIDVVPLPAANTFPPEHPTTPPEWHIASAELVDVTGDGLPEWILLVWRPWGDWPIQRWVPVSSPIAGHHDVEGDSCHVIVMDPRDGREIWAGSALPVPFVALAAGDVDGDGQNEVVTLEGDYLVGRSGPASHVNVWAWNGFGFGLEWRSPPGRFHVLRLTDPGNGGILAIAVR
jgi:hypothetical protein